MKLKFALFIKRGNIFRVSLLLLFDVVFFYSNFSFLKYLYYMKRLVNDKL